mgnify:CR=1 FL=1
MQPKPTHLGPHYAQQFCDLSVAESYRARPPYPEETFDILAKLLPKGHSRNILELGCGSGDLTVGLITLADRIDAVDISQPLLEIARSRLAKDIEKVHWFNQPAETFDSDMRYALVCAGASLHWMGWERLFPKLQSLLIPIG